MITKYDTDEDLKPRKNGAFFPAVVNFVLLVLVLGFMGGALAYYKDRIDTVSLNESLFITTEWHILQEMKAQTDQQLAEKDKEIAALRRRYRELALGSSNLAEMQRLEAQLQKAREEREEIASHRFDVWEDPGNEETGGDSESPDSPPEGPVLAITFPAGPSNPSLTDLLKQEIETLETRLEESELYNEILAEELALIRAAYQNTAAENRRIGKAVQTVRQTEEALNTVREILKRRREEADRGSPPRVEDLQNQALLQAVVSSPEMLAVYPGLDDLMERYLRVYALGQQLEGRREAYSEALEILGPEMAEMGIE